MDEENYTSLELSKKLKEGGCELPASKWWRKDRGIWSIGDIVTYIPAYDILNDICVSYRREFFGKEVINEPGTDSSYSAWVIHSEYILALLQDNKKKKAEDYIWEHCKFNPKNKK